MDILYQWPEDMDLVVVGVLNVFALLQNQLFLESNNVSDMIIFGFPTKLCNLYF